MRTIYRRDKMKFEKITAGMVLYDVHSYRMGNTRLMSLGVWSVRVISVDQDKRSAMVSWNGNQPEIYNERSLGRLRSVRPVLVRNGIGQCRRETREERAARLKASNSVMSGSQRPITPPSGDNPAAGGVTPATGGENVAGGRGRGMGEGDNA
jgi:hypothetical protein